MCFHWFHNEIFLRCNIKPKYKKNKLFQTKHEKSLETLEDDFLVKIILNFISFQVITDFNDL